MNAVGRDSGGVAVVYCPDLSLREWLVNQVESLAPSAAAPLQVEDVEGALQHPTRLALLVPSNEREAVLDLDASRDRMLEPGRSQPIVLFLLRDGDGARALAIEAPSLRSWIAGSDADPEKLAEVDVTAERAAFASEHGETPEAWLARWRAGAIPETSSNYRAAHQAALLEERGHS